MAAYKPTTKAQISGHRFLLRRVEHGLVLGDVRMLSDPLSQRRRALWMGVGASVLAAAGAGILAWLQPNPDPGQAAIVASEQGQVFARAEGTLHPVPNLVSAQLIAGSPDQPAAIGAEELRQQRLGSPIGIEQAPGFINPQATGGWVVCQGHLGAREAAFDTQPDASEPELATIVHANLPARELGADEAVLLRAADQDWIFGAEGRRRLPEGELGQAVARALGIEERTPRWEVTEDFLSTIPELPDYKAPGELPEVWEADGGVWASREDKLTRLTRVQADVLAGLGARTQRVPVSRVAQAEDSGDVDLGRLPESAPRVLDAPAQPGDAPERWLCASSEGAPAVARPTGGLVPLAGDSPATHFGGLEEGGVGVDTGQARLVVSATGTRHAVAGTPEWEALGISTPARVAWPLLRLLPEGPRLTREAALQAQPGQAAD